MSCHIKIISVVFIYLLISCSNEKKNSGELNEEAVDEIEEHFEIEAEAEAVDKLESGFTYNPNLSNEELYGLIGELLEKEDFGNASSLIEVFDFSIKDFEQKSIEQLKATANDYGFGYFNTLLNKFSQIEHPNQKVVDFLLKNGADPNTPSGSISELDYTFYPSYTTSCDKKTSEKLIKAGSKYALNGYLWCITNESIQDDSLSRAKEISELIAKGAEPNLALEFAAKNEDDNLFNHLLKFNADINQALYWAVEYERMELVQKLVKEGGLLKNRISTLDNGEVKLNNEDWDIRISNVAFSENDSLKKLVLNITDGTFYSKNQIREVTCEPSALIEAVKDQNIKAVEFMLKTGADPNEFCWPEEPWNNDNCARGVALFAAKNNEHQEMINLLLEYGAKSPEECENLN
jgi:ankyrin repeat protein